MTEAPSTEVWAYPTELEEDAKPRYRPLRMGDRVLITVTAIVMVVSFFAWKYGALISAGELIIGIALYVRVPRLGPMYDVVFFQPFDRLEQWLHDGWHYVSPDTPEDERPKLPWHKAKPSTELPRLLPNLHPLKGRDTDLGVTYDPSRKTDYAYIEVDSFDSAMRGPEALRHTQMSLGQMTTELMSIGEPGVKVGVGSVWQKRSGNIWPFIGFQLGAVQPSVHYAAEAAGAHKRLTGALTEEDDVHLHQLRTQEESLLKAAEGTDYTAAIVVGVKRPNEIVRALSSNEPLERRAVRNLPIWQMQDAACQLLRSMGAHNVQAMSHLRLHGLMRTAWDLSPNFPADDDTDNQPDCLSNYHRWFTETSDKHEAIQAMLEDPTRDTRHDKELLEELLEDLPDTMWPHRPGAYIRAHKDCIEFYDGHHHSWATTLMAGGMPTHATPDRFGELYMLNPAECVSVAYISDVSSSKGDVKAYDRKNELMRVIAEMRGKVSQSTTAMLAEQENRARAIERARSRASQAGKLAVAPVCRTRRDLDEIVTKEAGLMRKLQLKPYRVNARFLQLPAVLSAWFGIDLL